MTYSRLPMHSPGLGRKECWSDRGLEGSRTYREPSQRHLFTFSSFITVFDVRHPGKTGRILDGRQPWQTPCESFARFGPKVYLQIR